MVEGDEAVEVGVEELAVGAVGHAAEVAGVDHEDLAPAVAQARVGLVAGEQPQAHGDLGAVEELGGEGDHAVDEVGLDDGAADLALAAAAGGHGAIGEDEAGEAPGGEVVDDVRDPGEVGVLGRGDAEAPARVGLQAGGAPVLGVEGRVGEDVVGAQVGVEVAVEAVGVFGAEVAVDAAQGEVHASEAPGGGVTLLAEDLEVAVAAAVFDEEAFALDEHAAGAAGGVVDGAAGGGEHGDEQADDGPRGVELAAVFSLGGGEAGEEIFVDAAEDVAAALFGGAEAAEQAHEFAEQGALEAGALVDLREHAGEGGVVGLDRGHGGVDHAAEGGVAEAGLGAHGDGAPAGGGRDPEDAGGGVVGEVLAVVAGLVELVAVAFEGVGDVLEEQEAEDDVLVLGGVHVAAQLVGGLPEGGLEAEVAAAFGLGEFFAAQAGDVGGQVVVGVGERRGRWRGIGGGGPQVGFAARGWVALVDGAEGDAVGEGIAVAELGEVVGAGDGSQLGLVEEGEEVAEAVVGHHGELDQEFATRSRGGDPEGAGQLGEARASQGLEDGVLRDEGHGRGDAVLRHSWADRAGDFAGASGLVTAWVGDGVVVCEAEVVCEAVAGPGVG